MTGIVQENDGLYNTSSNIFNMFDYTVCVTQVIMYARDTKHLRCDRSLQGGGGLQGQKARDDHQKVRINTLKISKKFSSLKNALKPNFAKKSAKNGNFVSKNDPKKIP